MVKNRLWPVVAVLLIAAAFRLTGLSTIPPGLTHDEADHGLTAWGIVNGDRPIYSTVSYGREPLYDYATAGIMTIIGPTFLAPRLTAVYFSLIALAATFAWVNRAFGYKTALLTAAGLAIGFYAVMTGRQALRSITLPALFTLATLFFWRGSTPGSTSRSLKSGDNPPANSISLRRDRRRLSNYLFAGVFLGLTFYTYPPARVLWLLFPVYLLFLLLFDRDRFKQTWSGTAVLLVVTTAVALPIIIFLLNNPTAEPRLVELSVPLQAARSGDLDPLFQNVISGLKLLLFQGDHQWRYNIAGRPVLGPILAILFGAGVFLAIWRVIKGLRMKTGFQSAALGFFVIAWLILGLSPALVTGAELSTTKIVGLLPVLYLFPAFILVWVTDQDFLNRKLISVIVIALLATIGVSTAGDYFLEWANSPEVRVQYEHTVVTMVDYLNDDGKGQAALSTTTPDKYHSPAVGLLIQNNPAVNLRWFDGQHGLLIPQGQQSTILFSGFAPLSQYLEPYFDATEIAKLPLRSTDLDRPVTVYEVDGFSQLKKWMGALDQLILEPAGAKLPAVFGGNIELLGYKLQADSIEPGGVVRLVTAWRTNQAVEDAAIFAHVVGLEGRPIAQDDRLDIPSTFWQDGDLFLQLHEITLPDNMESGDYTLFLGIYSRLDQLRLPVNVAGQMIGDNLQLATFEVTKT